MDLANLCSVKSGLTPENWSFSDASISCTDGRHRLTHSSKLEIDWHFLLFDSSLVTLVSLVRLVTLFSLVTLVSLTSLITTVILVLSVHVFTQVVVSLVTIGIIYTLHNFQFYLAHLWTDLQSCSK